MLSFSLDISDGYAARGEAVILLHGLARRKQSMDRLASTLSMHGFQVYNLGYPSTKKDIEAIATEHLQPLLATLQKKHQVIHFVTHSMGGIVVRCYLEKHTMTPHGRVVMLAPPNQGSKWVDLLKNFALFKIIFGPAGRQLSTAPDSLPNRVGPASFEVGVIAGFRPVNPLSSFLFKEPNDGTVQVAHTRLAGMKDMVTIGSSHSFIMRNPEAINLTLRFLKYGRFR